MIDGLISKARAAMSEISGYSQEQTDNLIETIAKAIRDSAKPLAEEAIEETHLGRLDHKIGKNTVIATNIPNHLRGKKSVGVLREIKEKGLIEIAHPVGVVGSVAPTTNPSVTAIGNSLMALKGRNAVIISPHPRAKNVTKHTVDIMRDALASVGAPKDLIQLVENPTIELTNELMQKADVNVATGGPGLVKAAYSSGKPSYGVGAGNTQAILDEGFDIDKAVELSVISRAFDNGLICACAQSIIYPAHAEGKLKESFVKHGAAYIDDEADIEKFRQALFPGGAANPNVTGKSAKFIADLAGVGIPDGTEIIVLQIKKYGKDEVLTKEKMCPVMIAISYANFDEALKIVRANLEVAGKGHSVGIYSENTGHIVRMGIEMPVSRVMVNQPTIDAAGGPGNGLNPTPSLGCGSWGNNIISENLRYDHLLNISRISYPVGS
jgi:succinate-semialdehyde dehydrogenase